MNELKPSIKQTEERSSPAVLVEAEDQDQIAVYDQKQSTIEHLEAAAKVRQKRENHTQATVQSQKSTDDRAVHATTPVEDGSRAGTPNIADPSAPFVATFRHTSEPGPTISEPPGMDTVTTTVGDTDRSPVSTQETTQNNGPSFSPRPRPQHEQALLSGMKRCDHCKAVMPKVSYEKHLMACKRQCKQYGALVSNIDWKEHSKACRKCNWCEQYSSDFGEHKKMCPKWPMHCESCKQKISRDQFDTHVVECKVKQRGQKCNHCDKWFPGIQVHFKVCPKAPTKDCKWCNARVQKAAFGDHMNIHCPVPKADREDNPAEQGEGGKGARQ